MFAQLQLIIEGILIPCISVFGLIGNIFSILVLRSDGLDMKVGFFSTPMMNPQIYPKHQPILQNQLYMLKVSIPLSFYDDIMIS